MLNVGRSFPSSTDCPFSRCAHGTGDDSDSICIGATAGEPPSEIDDESTDARRWKSFANCCSIARDVDERACGENSSESVVPREDMEVIRLIPSALGRCRRRAGPGSLSTVAKEMTETPLGRSVDDIEWSSSKSRRLALATRSSLRQSPRGWVSSGLAKLPPAALKEETPWLCVCRMGPAAAG